MMYCTEGDVRSVSYKFKNDKTWNLIESTDIDGIILTASAQVLIDIGPGIDASQVASYRTRLGVYPPHLVRATAIRATSVIVNRYSFELSEGDTGIRGSFKEEYDTLVMYLRRTGLTAPDGIMDTPAAAEIIVHAQPTAPLDITSTFDGRRQWGSAWSQ